MKLLRRFEAIATGASFGDVFWLVVCLAVVILAMTLTPSDHAVSVFGFEVPVLCTWRRLTGWPCPGCGLTRSFTYFAHGQLIEAFRMNVFGPFAFVGVAGQIPWRIWRLWQRRVV